MSAVDRTPQTPRRPLRLWPGVAIVTVQWLLWLVVPVVFREASVAAMLGGVVGGLAVLVWWLFFSRAPWLERVGVIVLMVLAVAATSRVVHPSISNGMMGWLLLIYSIPALSLAQIETDW